MKFDDFKVLTSKIQNMPLPGKDAHYKMSSQERIENILKSNALFKKARKAAVLCFFYPDEDNQTKFVLTLRHTYRGVHSNQISLPGGKFEDTDSNLEFTAKRETEEEVGVANVTILKELTKVFIPPSNFIVQPYVGVVDVLPSFKLQEAEVASLVQVYLSDLLNDEKVCVVKRKTSYAAETEVPAFNFDGNIVWGATAMMLNEVKLLFKQAL